MLSALASHSSVGSLSLHGDSPRLEDRLTDTNIALLFCSCRRDDIDRVCAFADCCRGIGRPAA